MPKEIYKKCILFILIFSCSDNSTESSKNSFQINIPLNQKVIHANASYLVDGSSTSLQFLSITSLLFSETQTINDTIYISGTIEQYTPVQFNGGSSISGNIKLSLTDKWIAIEDLSENMSASVFLKGLVDSTALPFPDFQHIPVYPRVLREGDTKEIIRPQNSVSDWQIGPLYRKFRIGQSVRWDDSFGFSDGIFVETTQYDFQSDTLFISSMYDEKGLYISQYTLLIIISNQNNPTLSDTLFVQQLNRRIKDYSNPLFVEPLDFYANQVINRGITFFYN